LQNWRGAELAAGLGKIPCVLQYRCMFTFSRYQQWAVRLALPALLLAAVIFAWQSVQGLGHSVVVITWSTASELDTAGFNLYRSLASGGLPKRVNTSLIPSTADPLTGGEYRYEDAAALPGRLYLYELEAVSLNGSRERLGQIEIRAQRGGWLELSAAGACLVFAMVLVRARKKPAASEASPAPAVPEISQPAADL
jgi:hypothetical protein